ERPLAGTRLRQGRLECTAGVLVHVSADAHELSQAPVARFEPAQDTPQVVRARRAYGCRISGGCGAGVGGGAHVPALGSELRAQELNLVHAAACTNACSSAMMARAMDWGVRPPRASPTGACRRDCNPCATGPSSARSFSRRTAGPRSPTKGMSEAARARR